MLCCVVLYCFVLYCIVLYCIVIYCIALYFVKFCVLWFVAFCVFLCVVVFCVLCCVVCFVMFCVLSCVVLYGRRKKVRAEKSLNCRKSRTFFPLKLFPSNFFLWLIWNMEAEVLQQWQTTHFKACSNEIA